jgi:hypothetical protein
MQECVVLDILSDSDMTDCRPSDFPMEQHLYLRPNDGTPLSDPTVYHCLVGCLLYLTVKRPDIQYAVNTLSQFMQSPCSSHFDSATRVLRYLKGSVGKGLFLSASSSINLVGYADSDWAGCTTTQRSTAGYFMMFGSNPISWKTKKQPTISCSSSEAEYRSLATLSSELKWLKYLLSDLGIDHPQLITIYCDSQAAIHIAENPVFHEHTKHIEIDCHFVCEKN